MRKGLFLNQSTSLFCKVSLKNFRLSLCCADCHALSYQRAQSCQPHLESLCSFSTTLSALPPSDPTVTCTAKVTLKVRAAKADCLDIARIPLRRAECSATSRALQGQMSHIIPAVRLGFTPPTIPPLPPGSNLARAAQKKKGGTLETPLNGLLREVREKDSAMFLVARTQQVPHRCGDAGKAKQGRKPRSSVATNKSALSPFACSKFKDKSDKSQCLK